MSNLRRRACLVSLALVAAPFVIADPAAAGGGCHRSESEQTEASGTTVEMSTVCMNPTVLQVDAGDEVTFVNRDPVPHNALGVGWGTQELGPGESGSHTFDRAGTYPYACSLHPGMVGAVVVGGEGETAAAAAEDVPTSSSGISGLTAAVGAAGALALGAALLLRRSRRGAAAPVGR